MGNKKDLDTRFNRFGTVSFTATTRVNDFIDYLDQNTVAGTRCQSCGRHFFPPRADCCDCLCGDIEWFSLKGVGKLATFSTLQYGPSGFEDEVPYTVGVLEYDVCRVFGRISKKINPETLEIGLPMVAQVVRLDNGQLSFEFLPNNEVL